jgi:hypothetical protein
MYFQMFKNSGQKFLSILYILIFYVNTLILWTKDIFVSYVRNAKKNHINSKY